MCPLPPFFGSKDQSSVRAMRLGSWQWVRSLQMATLSGLALASACDSSPVPDSRTGDLRVGEEVYRMFCMRVARGAYPSDPNGYRFIPLCEGTSSDASDIDNPKLVALIERRAQTVAALDQVLGDETVEQSKPFSEDELEDFLLKLLPFYGEEGDTILPRSTRALGRVMERLTDPDDENGKAVLATIARISERVGYRAPDRVLAAVRPTLTYDRLDELTSVLLDFVAEGKTGHEAFMAVLEAATLELAEPGETKENPTTLQLALDLVLKPDDNFVKAEKPKTLAPLLVLERDPDGNAKPVGAASATPFRVAGRSDDADRDPVTTMALGSGGAPAYETFDANQTALASLMRDSIPLIRRGTEDRSTIERLLRMSRALLGPEITRSETFGGKTLSYQGQDVKNGPMGHFLHAFTTLLKLPETKPLLRVLEQLMRENEGAATELIYAALQIHEESKKSDYDGAKLGGGNPHEFWDDLIKFGQDIIANRPGLLVDILKATLDPLTAAQAPILAHQMQFRDEVKLASAADINSNVTTGCAPGGPAYCVPVVRMSGGDVGMNRSIFQRTLSLIHSTYLTQNCNKKGATLTVQQPIPTTFPNPGGITALIGCPDSKVAPPPAKSYEQCQVIAQKSAAVTQMRAILGRAEVVLKDDEIEICATAAGTSVDESQERESGIKGFTTKPTAKALARFVYAPRNKFLSDLFEPLSTVDGVSLVEYEPNGIYPLEMIDPEAIGPDGSPNAFLTAIAPLLTAFDNHETFDELGDYKDKYYFAELFDLVHMHYSSPKTEPCPQQVVAGNEGCTQSVNPARDFYSHGTNLVSYEPLLAYALLDQRLLSVLQRSTQALQNIAIDGRNGVDILASFVEAVLKPNTSVSYADGRAYAKTNKCVIVGDEASPTCQPGPDGQPVGRIIEGGVPPLYLLLDALSELDAMWEKNQEAHALYLDVRSTLVDQLLDVTKAADGQTALTNRRAYALTRRALPWLLERISAHEAAGDLDDWAGKLVARLDGVLGHPLAARGMDLFDKFWENREAGDEVAKLLTYLLDEDENPTAFTGAIVALSDTLTFVNTDPGLTSAIRFAALALADDALDVVDGKVDAPNIKEGTAYRFLEVTREIARVDEGAELSVLARILRNSVLPMANSELPELDGKSPLEVFIDMVAEVNRSDPSEPATTTLSAEDDKLVFEELNQFLTSKEIGLERLYEVIENRNIQ